MRSGRVLLMCSLMIVIGGNLDRNLPRIGAAVGGVVGAGPRYHAQPEEEAFYLRPSVCRVAAAVAEGRLGPPRRWAAERSGGDAVRWSERERLG